MLPEPRLVLFQMMRVPFGDDVEDGSVRGQRHVLLETRDPERGLTPDVARIGLGDLDDTRLQAAIKTVSLRELMMIASATA